MGNCARNVSHMYLPIGEHLEQEQSPFWPEKLHLLKHTYKKKQKQTKLKIRENTFTDKKKKHSQSTSVKWSQTNRD